MLNTIPQSRVGVIGYIDSLELNCEDSLLAKQRTNVVKALLINQGIDSNRIYCEASKNIPIEVFWNDSIFKESSILNESTISKMEFDHQRYARILNRRVELIYIPK